jgi:hypothetical protein
MGNYSRKLIRVCKPIAPLLAKTFGTIAAALKLGGVDNPSRTIGEGLRRLFSVFIRRPMDWSLIDAFARLEEREQEAQIDQPDEPTGSILGDDGPTCRK